MTKKLIFISIIWWAVTAIGQTTLKPSVFIDTKSDAFKKGIVEIKEYTNYEVYEQLQGLMKKGNAGAINSDMIRQAYITRKVSLAKGSYIIDNNEQRFEFEIGNFFLNTKLRILKYKDEEPMKLSPKENELLRLLALHTDDFMSRELALSKIWKDDNYFTSRSMDVYIAKLRKLLKKDDKVEILNIHGEGFRLVANKEAEGFV